jgi:ATP-binding cassette, subfamily B, multidrug efflux pump
MSDKKGKSFKTGSVFNFGLMRRIFSLASPYKRQFYISGFITISVSFLGPIRPYIIQHTIDNYIANGDEQGLIKMGITLFGLLLFTALLQLWGTFLTNYLGQSIIKDLRNRVYKFLSTRQLKFYDKTSVGTLVTRCISDIETITDVFAEGLINITGDLLQIIFVLGLMFFTDWKLSVVTLSVLPFLFYAGYWFKEKVRISFEEVRTQVTKLNTFVQEHITGMQIVQIFNREEQEYAKFQAINAEHRDANIKGVFYYSVFFPIVEIISAVSTGLIVWYGAKGIIDHHTSVGVIIVFIMYITLFFRPIRQLADRFNTLQMGMVASERIFKLLDETEFDEPSGDVNLTHVKGELEFKKVWFAYVNEEYVLKDISFKVNQGKTLAIVGATGAGKSSIINLMNRFYEINKGEILLDGHNIKDISNQSLRANISVVLQDVFLFNGSILDNIRLYDKSLSDEKIIETSKLLGADYFIQQLPDGYHQKVQERGATLSVGQRQLISFIRAMVNNPSILILDEATSSVDNETEEVIQKAISKMMNGRTSIVIAHRLSTIRYANEIIVMEKGQIMERGSHQDLLDQNGLYKQLYEHQFLASE